MVALIMKVKVWPKELKDNKDYKPCVFEFDIENDVGEITYFTTSFLKKFGSKLTYELDGSESE